jgi:uncharacterized protein (TIGR02246 family)
MNPDLDPAAAVLSSGRIPMTALDREASMRDTYAPTGQPARHWSSEEAVMSRRVFTVGTLLVVLTLAPLVFARQAPVDPELQKVADAYMQAWAKSDAKAIAALYTENGVRAGSDGQLYRGRDAIEQGFLKAFAGPFKGSKLTLRTEHDQVITKDSVRIATGTYEVSGVASPPPGAALKGRFVNTMVRQNGRWLLASSAAIGTS